MAGKPVPRKVFVNSNQNQAGYNYMGSYGGGSPSNVPFMGVPDPVPVVPPAQPPNSGNGGGGGGGTTQPQIDYSPSPAPVPVAPVVPVAPYTQNTIAVKQPAPSLVNYNAEALPQELLTDLLYEDVGGQEIISIARHDTIDGQNVSYSLISNLSIFNQAFNPTNILAGQIAYSTQFGQYALDLSNKLDLSDPTADSPFYLDADGNLVIELVSIGTDEYVEVEISSNGTIYKTVVTGGGIPI